MKLIPVVLAAVALGLASISLASADLTGVKIADEPGMASVEAYNQCFVTNGYDRALAASITKVGKLAFINYDPGVQQNMDAITDCSLPYFNQLNDACDCVVFDKELGMYRLEYDRLFAWLQVDLICVAWDGVTGSAFECFIVGDSRYQNVIRYGMMPSFAQLIVLGAFTD